MSNAGWPLKWMSSSDVVLTLLHAAIDAQSRIDKPAAKTQRSKPGERCTREVICKQMDTLGQLLSRIDDQLLITRRVEHQLALMLIAREVNTFFYKHLVQLKSTPLTVPGETASHKQIPKLIHFERIRVYKQREEYGKVIEMQKLLREMGAHRRDPHEELNLDIPDDEQHAEEEEAMDLTAACTVLQTWERVYQSMSRSNYLREVRQKAADLHTAQTPIDPLRAIVMIQARTRGYLARKAVRRMRNEELNVLAMSVESLLKSQIEQRARCSNEQGSVVLTEEQLANMKTSLSELLNDMQETYFTTAPEFGKGARIPRRKDDRRENLYHDLLIAGIIKHRPKSEQISLDEMSSYDVSATIGRSKVVCDMRNIIYCTTVIPHMLLPWRLPRVVRRALLLIGGERSGKTAWCCAVAEKCAAAHICVSASNFAVKGAKKLGHTIEQFARRDEYCVIEVDRLEVFSTTKKRKTLQKTVMCSLLESLKEVNAQVIGMSRTPQIDEEIAPFFPNIIRLSNPDSVARFNLISDRLSRRLENEKLPKIPPRLTDLCKATRKMNCGSTVARVIARVGK